MHQASDGLEPTHHTGAVQSHPRHSPGQVAGELDDDRLARGLDCGHADVRAATVHEQERRGTGRGIRRKNAVDTPFEATRGLARQFVPA